MITSLELKDRRTFTESILRQTVELLLRHTEGTQVEETSPLTVPKHSDDIYWRTGAHILGRIAEKPEYTVLLKMILFDPLEAAFTGDNRHLVQGERPIGDVQAAIRVTYRLLLARVCPEHVAPLFSHLFYARLAYAKKKTVLVSEELESALKEALRELPKAYFLLDEAVHKEAIQEWTGRYDVNGEDGRLRILRKIERDDSEPPEEVARRIAELTVKLLGEREATDVTFRFNFFFLLLGRLNEGIGSGTATGQQPHSLVTLSLIESLSERLFGGTISKAQEEAREGKLLADPQTMRFLALTFQKTVQQLSRWKGDELEEEELPELRAEDGRLMGESVQFCIAILELYVMKEEKAVLKDEETAKGASIVADLKLCHVSLGELLKCREFDRFAELLGDGAPVLRLKLEDLYSQLEKRLRPDWEDEEGETREMDVARCLRDLTHPLMPLQAHALITLKYLIVQRDPAIEGHFEAIMDALKGCLANSDSYIYLAAINTLGQLAIRHTQAVLPLLLEQFASGTSRRSAVDRLKTGEVLRQLARSIGDFAYHYADSFIGRLLPVVKCGNEPELRMSALSVLGEYCSAYQHGLGKYIVELTTMIEGIAEEGSAPIEVTRAAAFFLRYLLQGLTADGALNLAEHMRLLYGTVKRFDRHLDEVVMMHAGLARDELSRISEELLRREGTPGERGSFLRESKMATLIGKE